MCRIWILISWLVFLSSPGCTQEPKSPEKTLGLQELQSGPPSSPNGSPSQATLTCTLPESTSHLPICKFALLLLPSDSTDKSGAQEIFQLAPQVAEKRISPLLGRLAGATLAADRKLPQITLHFPEVTCPMAGSYACEVLQIQSGENVGRGRGGGDGGPRFGGEEECKRIVAGSDDEVEDRKNASGVVWQRSVFRVEKLPGQVSMEVAALPETPFSLLLNCSVITSLQVEWIWEVHSLTRGWIRTQAPQSSRTSAKPEPGQSACRLQSSLMSRHLPPYEADTGVDVSNVRCYVIAQNKTYLDRAGYLNASLGGQRFMQSMASSTNAIANDGLVLIGGLLLVVIVLLILLVRLERQGTFSRLRTRVQRSGGHWRRSHSLGLSGDGDKHTGVKDNGPADLPPALSPRPPAEGDTLPPPNKRRQKLSPRTSSSLRVEGAEERGRACPTLEVANERKGGPHFCKIISRRAPGKAQAPPSEECPGAEGFFSGGQASAGSTDAGTGATLTPYGLTPKTTPLQSLDKVIREISAEAQIATERILKSHQNTLKDSEAERKDGVHGESAASSKKLQLPVHSKTSLMRLKLSENIKAAVKEQQQDTGHKKIRFPRLSTKSPPKLPSPERPTTRTKHEKSVALSLMSPPKVHRSAAAEVGNSHADDPHSHECKMAESHAAPVCRGDWRNKSWHVGTRSLRRLHEKQSKSSSVNREAAAPGQSPVRSEDAGTKEKWSATFFGQSPLVHKAMRVCSSPPKLNLAFKLRQEKHQTQKSLHSAAATKEHPRKFRQNWVDRTKSKELENYVSLNKITLKRVGRFRPQRTVASERGHLNTFTHSNQPSPQFAYERQAPSNNEQTKIRHSFSENKMATIVIRNRSCDDVSQRTRSSNSLVTPSEARAALPLGRQGGEDPQTSVPTSRHLSSAVLGNLSDPMSKSVGDLCSVSKQQTTGVREQAACGDSRLQPLQQSCGHIPGTLTSMQAPDVEGLPLADTVSSECSINLSLYSTTSSLMSAVSGASKDSTQPNSLCTDFDQVSECSALERSSLDKADTNSPSSNSSLPLALQGGERSQSVLPVAPESSRMSPPNQGYDLPCAAPVTHPAAHKQSAGVCSYSTSNLPQLQTRAGVQHHSSQVSISTTGMSDLSKKHAPVVRKPWIISPAPTTEPDMDKALVRPAAKDTAEVPKSQTNFLGKEFASADKTGNVTVNEDLCFLPLESSPTGDCYLCEQDFPSGTLPGELAAGQLCVADVGISGGSDGEGSVNFKKLSGKTSKKLPSLTDDCFGDEATELKIQTKMKGAHVSQVGDGTTIPCDLSPQTCQQKSGHDKLNADTCPVAQCTLEKDSAHVEKTSAKGWTGRGGEKVTLTPAAPGSSAKDLVQHSSHLVFSFGAIASQNKVNTDTLVRDLKTTLLESREEAYVKERSHETNTPQCQRMENCAEQSKLNNTVKTDRLESSIKFNANGLEPTPLGNSKKSKEAEYTSELSVQESSKELAKEIRTSEKELYLQCVLTEHDLAVGLKKTDEGKCSCSMDTIYDIQRKVSEKDLQSASATSNPLTACEEHELKTKCKDGRLMSHQPYCIRRTTEKHMGNRDTREATRKETAAEDTGKHTQPNPLSQNDTDFGKSCTSTNIELETTKHPQFNGQNLMHSEQGDQGKSVLKDTDKDQKGSLGVLHGESKDGNPSRCGQSHQMPPVTGNTSLAPHRPPDLLQFFKGENERMTPEGSTEITRVSLKLI